MIKAVWGRIGSRGMMSFVYREGKFFKKKKTEEENQVGSTTRRSSGFRFGVSWVRSSCSVYLQRAVSSGAPGN